MRPPLTPGKRSGFTPACFKALMTDARCFPVCFTNIAMDTNRLIKFWMDKVQNAPRGNQSATFSKESSTDRSSPFARTSFPARTRRTMWRSAALRSVIFLGLPRRSRMLSISISTRGSTSTKHRFGEIVFGFMLACVKRLFTKRQQKVQTFSNCNVPLLRTRW
jgi:hypothetical protein